MLDDIWGTVLEPFADDPARAFILAQALHHLKEALKSGSEGRLAVITAFDDAIQKLYLYTDTYRSGYELYLLAVAGELKPQHDPTLIVREARLTVPRHPQ